MIGPLVFTEVFAFAIVPRRAVQLPGAPYWLASALLLGSFVIAWIVTRRAAAAITAGDAAG
jgi:hypothetical protein